MAEGMQKANMPVVRRSEKQQYLVLAYLGLFGPAVLDASFVWLVLCLPLVVYFICERLAAAGSDPSPNAVVDDTEKSGEKPPSKLALATSALVGGWCAAQALEYYQEAKFTRTAVMGIGVFFMVIDFVVKLLRSRED